MLFLGIGDFVRSTYTGQTYDTWATVFKLLLPSAQTLKAVMLLYSSAKGCFSVCRLLAACYTMSELVWIAAVKAVTTLLQASALYSRDESG